MAELALSKVVWLRAHPLLPEGKGVHPSELQLGFPGGSAGKESACNAEDLGLIPSLGKSPGEVNGYLLQYPSLENSMNSMGLQIFGHD